MNKEQYIFSNHKYICFLTVALNAINEANIPKYTSRFSKKRYSQHQLLALLLLKEYLNCGYRELTEILELTDILQKQLMLKGIPGSVEILLRGVHVEFRSILNTDTNHYYRISIEPIYSFFS